MYVPRQMVSHHFRQELMQPSLIDVGCTWLLQTSFPVLCNSHDSSHYSSLVPGWEGELVVSSTTTLTSRVDSVILLAGKVCPSSPFSLWTALQSPILGLWIFREAILFPNGISEGNAEGRSLQSIVLRIAEQHTWELA